MNAAIDEKSFGLMKDGRFAHRDLIAPVDAAARQHSQRRLPTLHRSNLHVRGVRAQQELIDIEKERVLHVARGMIGREIERLEVVPIRFHFGPRIERVAHLQENLLELAPNDRDRMQVTEGREAGGEGDVEGPLAHLFLRGDLRGFFVERRFDAIAQLVQRIADGSLLFFRDLFESLEKGRNGARFSAEIAHANLVQRGRIIRCC